MGDLADDFVNRMLDAMPKWARRKPKRQPCPRCGKPAVPGTLDEHKSPDGHWCRLPGEQQLAVVRQRILAGLKPIGHLPDEHYFNQVQHRCSVCAEAVYGGMPLRIGPGPDGVTQTLCEQCSTAADLLAEVDLDEYVSEFLDGDPLEGDR